MILGILVQLVLTLGFKYIIIFVDDFLIWLGYINEKIVQSLYLYNFR